MERRSVSAVGRGIEAVAEVASETEIFDGLYLQIRIGHGRMVFVLVLSTPVYLAGNGIGGSSIKCPAVGYFAGMVVIPAICIVDAHEWITHHHVVDVVPINIADPDAGIDSIRIRQVFAELQDI